MKESSRPIRFEPRWPVILEILFVAALLALLRARISIFPGWVTYIAGGVFVLPMIGAWISNGHPLWLRIERMTTFVLSVLTETVALATLGYLIKEMFGNPAGFSGRQLLASSIGVWTINVMVFSLLYWQIDRGGPEARANLRGVRPDWHFPQSDALEETQPNWRPTYVDYLFLSFSTATAFSAADILPLTSRAKLLMMFESSVSLITLVIVASRAINILGG